MRFQEQTVRFLLETISIIRQGIDMIDDGKEVKAGALLGSQVCVITDFLRKNNQKKTLVEALKKMEAEQKEFAEQFLKKNGKPDFTYIG